MSAPAIRVDGLGKRYVLRHQRRSRYVTLRDEITEGARSLGRALLGRGRDGAREREEFWALRDVSFAVAPGERLGIVGRNGAGKSTLLKLLGRIAEPTTGRIEVEGRIASLLEVGTGFHPELTGRENVFLNGAILGMGRAEIRRKFDQIVAFAEVEKFLDTPVKRYSSGMYVRLAFAVAAHLEPEILLVDEVLAVGDAEFQKKCLGRMEEVGREGRTVLFVSHNMGAVTRLCERVLVLSAGEVVFDGQAEEAVGRYLTSVGAARSPDAAPLPGLRPGWARPLVTGVHACGRDGARTTLLMGEGLQIDVSFVAGSKGALRDPVVGVVINHASFGPLASVSTYVAGFRAPHPCASATVRCVLPHLPFLPGRYTADVSLGDGPEPLDLLCGCLSFDIEGGDVYGTGKAPQREGVVYLLPEFSLLEAAPPGG